MGTENQFLTSLINSLEQEEPVKHSDDGITLIAYEKGF